jgi:ABC-type phosphate transport system substrate-binding protein
MRVLAKLITVGAAVAAATAIAAGPALASPAGARAMPKDPPGTTVPRESDLAGVGSDTIEFLFDQFSHDYNATHSATHRRLYSWDATNPGTGAVGDSIVVKANCTAIARPDGSSAGIAALDANAQTADKKHFCIDYARASRGRASTDPAFAPGGIAFVALATDGVTFATQATTHAPNNLTTAQLASIYNCVVTNWDQVGGKNAPIHPFLPQTGSGTRAFFLGAIGVSTPGSCVNSTVQENEGVDPQLNDPNAVVPYSIAKFIAEKYHSAACINSDCSPSGGVECTPGAGQNLFGCDEHGTMVLRQINGTKPLAGVAPNKTINPGFSPTFLRTVYEVVRYSGSTPDHIPSYLEPFFASASATVKGWTCNSAAARTDIKHYGFLPSALCGLTS